METADEDTIKNAIRDDTKLILVETPTNPTLKLVSIPLLSRLAHTHPAHPILMVDNTFASPFYQNPLMLGADLVLHSLTKYVNGHSDVVMGGVIVPDVEGSHLANAVSSSSDATHTPVPHPSPAHLRKYFDTLRFMQNALGAVPSAYDSWLAQRGLKTLHLRMKAHGRNALAVARAIRSWVRETNAVGGVPNAAGKLEKIDIKVGYAGLPVEEFDFVEGDEERKATQANRHALAWRMLSAQAKSWVEDEIRPMQAFSLGQPASSLTTTSPPPLGFPYTGMLTLTLPTYDHSLTFLTALNLFTLAESLGGVESLAEHPASMTHAGIPAAERRASGVEDGLVRMSVGVEDGADLVADVRRALAITFGIHKH